MAGRKRTDDPGRVLREKYQELAAKYSALVGRSQQRWNFRDAMQNAVRGISSASLALAVAQEGRIVFRNAAYVELERGMRWTLASEPRRPPLPLRAWAIRTMDEMPAGMATRALRLRDPDGTRLISLRLERQRRPPAFLIWAEDVTAIELREIELAEVRQSLIQQHRLLMLGEAAAAVAHDLGSTLRGLAFRTASLRLDGRMLSEHAETLGALEEGLQLATAMVQRLHDFARSGAPRLQAVDIGAVLHSAVALFELETEATRSKVRVRLSVPELPPMQASSADLSHLFLNLLRNAADAMPRGGEIRVRARVNRKAVVLVFEDQGVGVPPALVHRLFEAYFTTKGPRGTGLGLWLAAGTMRRMGGKIVAAPKKGGGTRFTLTFPRGLKLPADLPLPPAGDGGRPPASWPLRNDLRTARRNARSLAAARASPSDARAPPAPRARAAPPTARPRSSPAARRGRSRE